MGLDLRGMCPEGHIRWGSYSFYHTSKLPLMLFAYRYASFQLGLQLAAPTCPDDAKGWLTDHQEKLDTAAAELVETIKGDDGLGLGRSPYMPCSENDIEWQRLLVEAGVIGVLWIVAHSDCDGWLSVGQTYDVAQLFEKVLEHPDLFAGCVRDSLPDVWPPAELQEWATKMHGFFTTQAENDGWVVYC